MLLLCIYKKWNMRPIFFHTLNIAFKQWMLLHTSFWVIVPFYLYPYRRVNDSWPPVRKFGHHVSNHCGLVTRIQTNTQSYPSQLPRILTALCSCNKAAVIRNMVAQFTDRWQGIFDRTVPNFFCSMCALYYWACIQADIHLHNVNSGF